MLCDYRFKFFRFIKIGPILNLQEASVIDLIKETFSEWQKNKASRLAAALAFYAILSIPPLMVLIVALVGQFASEAAARQEIVRQLGRVMGSESAREVVETFLNAAHQPEGLSLAAITSAVVLLFGASGVFVQLQETLNTVWNVMPDPERGFMHTIQKRIVSFVMVLGLGVLLLVLLVLSTAVAFLGSEIEAALPGSLPVVQVLNGIVAFLLLIGVFALMFRTIPDVQVEWRDVTPGAVVTAVLFLLGVLAIGLYLQNTDLTSSYGAAGSLIVLMVGIFYSAQVFFLGAEFTKVYAQKHGSNIKPEEGAVHVRRVTGEEAIAQTRAAQEGEGVTG
jgi:membrane protein